MSNHPNADRAWKKCAASLCELGYGHLLADRDPSSAPGVTELDEIADELIGEFCGQLTSSGEPNDLGRRLDDLVGQLMMVRIEIEEP